MINKKDISYLTRDMIYHDIINDNIKLPVNDAVLVSINLDKIKNKKLVQLNNNQDLSDTTTLYIKALTTQIEKTLNASTKIIYELEKEL